MLFVSRTDVVVLVVCVCECVCACVCKKQKNVVSVSVLCSLTVFRFTEFYFSVYTDGQ